MKTILTTKLFNQGVAADVALKVIAPAKGVPPHMHAYEVERVDGQLLPSPDGFAKRAVRMLWPDSYTTIRGRSEITKAELEKLAADPKAGIAAKWNAGLRQHPVTKQWMPAEDVYAAVAALRAAKAKG